MHMPLPAITVLLIDADFRNLKPKNILSGGLPEA